MYMPTLEGIIDRRLLINYRVDPEYLQRILPAPFRPKLLHGKGIAGICLIRLRQLRPRGLPAQIGFASENAAHRIAVEWEERGQYREGVYIPRRDTASRVTLLIGGKLFPGAHYHATFQVKEKDGAFSVRMASDDGETRVSVQSHIATRLPEHSIFASLEEASAFFEHGLRGYSVTNKPGILDSLELRCKYWKVEPLQVTEAQSSFFDDQERFPKGVAELDCALLMRSIPHEWHVQEPFHLTEKEGSTKNVSETAKSL